MRRALAVAAGLSLTIACGPAQPAPKPAPGPPPAPKLHDGPLTDYVPAAGLRWMAVARLSELAKAPALSKASELLFPKQRLDAFAKSSGVDLRTAEVAVAAGFDYATLYLVQIEDSGTRIEEAFSERLVAGPRRSAPHPRMRRVSGVVGRTPQTLVLIDEQLAAVSVGSQTPARVVELFALEKLEKSPPALAGSALRSLPHEQLNAPVVFYAPGPFLGEWEHGARGLLATSVALAVAARPLDERRIEVTLFLAGDFRAPDATTRLVDAWDDLGQSNMGRLLGLNAPAAAPIVSATPDLLRMRVELEVGPLAQGLRAAVVAEVWEFLDLPPPAKKPAPNPRKP